MSCTIAIQEGVNVMISFDCAGKYGWLESELDRGVHHLDESPDSAFGKLESVERVTVSLGNGA